MGLDPSPPPLCESLAAGRVGCRELEGVMVLASGRVRYNEWKGGKSLASGRVVLERDRIPPSWKKCLARRRNQVPRHFSRKEESCPPSKNKKKVSGRVRFREGRDSCFLEKMSRKKEESSPETFFQEGGIMSSLQKKKKKSLGECVAMSWR